MKCYGYSWYNILIQLEASLIISNAVFAVVPWLCSECYYPRHLGNFNDAKPRTQCLTFIWLTLAKPPSFWPSFGGLVFCCCRLSINSSSNVSLANTSPTVPVIRAPAPVKPPKNKNHEPICESDSGILSRHELLQIIHLSLQQRKSSSTQYQDLQRIPLAQAHFPERYKIWNITLIVSVKTSFTLIGS